MELEPGRARTPEARRGSQGASRAAPGKSGLHARGEGRLGFPGALPQRRVVWMWFGAFPGAFGPKAVGRSAKGEIDEGKTTSSFLDY